MRVYAGIRATILTGCAIAVLVAHPLFERGKSVYVIAVPTTFRGFAPTSFDFEADRNAKSEFQKEGWFRVAPRLADADLVFLIVIDLASPGFDEIGMAVPGSVYRDSAKGWDRLRDVALWQGESHFRRRHPRSPLSKELVKQFYASLGVSE